MAARAPVLALALLLGAASQAGAVANVKDNLYGVKALSPTEAWVVGNFGAIYHTRDGGKNWDASESGVKGQLFSVDFADADHGWAVGKAATILATTDGGRTWKAQSSPIPAEKHLFSVRALDARTAWAVGDWGAIVATHDGGATWEDHSLPDDVVLYDVDFPDAEHGFIGGEFGTVLASTDAGKTWDKQDLGTDKTIFGIGFASPEKGWAVGIDGIVLRTRDGGRSWSVQRGKTTTDDLEDLGFMESLKNPGFYDVAVAGQYGAVIGDTGTVLTTSDGGETWVQHNLPEEQRLIWLRGLSLVPGTHGFLVGARGFVGVIDHDRVVPTRGNDAAPAAP